MKRIGSLWLNETQDKKKYMTGVIEIVSGIQTPIVIFTNDKKDKQSQPDRIIYLSEPKKVLTKENNDLKVSEEKIKRNDW